MRIAAGIGLLMLTLGGCAKTGEAARSPAEREEATARKEVRRAVERLREDVTEMQRNPAMDQRDLVAALRSAADALAALPESEAVGARIMNIETYADQIAQSAPRARQQSAWARSALLEGAATLEEVSAARGRADMQPWIRAIRARADGIDPNASILEQRDAIIHAFDDLTEATDFLGAQKPPGEEPVG